MSQVSSRVDPLMGIWGVNAIWIVGSFMLVMTICVSLYKGELTTSMTAVVFPHVPLTLQEVAESGIPVICAGKYENGGNLEYHINNAIALGIYGKKVSSTLEKLERNIFLPRNYAYRIGRNISQQDKLYEYNTTRELITKGKILAIMDSKLHTDEIIDGIKSSNAFLVFQGKEDLSFKEHLMWVLYRNFFTKFYQRSWAGVVEGGFTERFLQVMRLSHARLRSKQLGVYSREYFLRALFKDPPKKTNDDFASVNQESVLYCYYILLLLLSIAIVTFGAEVCFKFRNHFHPLELFRKIKLMLDKAIRQRRTQVSNRKFKSTIAKSICKRRLKTQAQTRICGVLQIHVVATTTLDTHFNNSSNSTIVVRYSQSEMLDNSTN